MDDPRYISMATRTDVREAVIAIRRAKLPQPDDIGNAGSFFKNPYVDFEKLKQLQELYPDIPFFETDNGYKIPSAWLIEWLGWKGYREGDAGVHDKQPLVLVNHGEATGEEIRVLSEKIQESVENEFGITLEPEVTIL